MTIEKSQDMETPSSHGGAETRDRTKAPPGHDFNTKDDATAHFTSLRENMRSPLNDSAISVGLIHQPTDYSWNQTEEPAENHTIKQLEGNDGGVETPRAASPHLLAEQEIQEPPPFAAVEVANEAQNQAEHAGIDVDAHEETDAGYETDSIGSASTSLASSVRNYAFENGRRYHKFREGAYNFPNDETEQDREDMKHACMINLCGVHHFAPIGPNPQNVLDMGTGTGIWAIEMGDLYPSANILGVDLSPIQPTWVPPNVKFMVDDIESPWLHRRNQFDYIHGRHIVMAIRNWDALMSRAYQCIKPGGWYEQQEMIHLPHCLDGTMSPDWPIYRYWSTVIEGLKNLGIDFLSTTTLADRMRNAGFINVTERVFNVPLGTWPRNKVLKMVGLYWRTVLLDGTYPIAIAPLTRGLKYTKEDVELFIIDVRKAYMDLSVHSYMPFYIIYGQRAESDVGRY